MSAFVVENSTINKIVSRVKELERKRELPPNWALAFGMPEIDPARLGRILFDLNCDAVRQRYEDADKDMIPATYSYRFESDVGRIRAYKSLQCLIYQCSEGDVPETPVYQALGKLQAWMADSIVSELPEYERAYWG